jgi:Zn-dependent peptidase ImmA (M78 family)/DNA-binding XRE family transcriptional regulator
MKQPINGEMITLAREAMGMTQSALSSELGIKQSTLSRYERGGIDVPPEHIQQLTISLQRPISFFCWRERLYPSSCLYHRKRKRLPEKELRRIHAWVNILRIQAVRLLERAEIETHYTFHRLDIHRLGGPEKAAQALRHLWQVQKGPIKSCVDLVERAGGIVFCFPFGSSKVDGISQWPIDQPEIPPVFFLSDSFPGDRMRWTICHEIGHIVMHHLPTDDLESEADRFAAEFLMPASEISSQLCDLTLARAAALKSFWRVSMQALIRRAKQLGKISQNQYEYLFKQMAMRGYRTCEPVLVPRESPRLLPQLVDVHRAAAKGDFTALTNHLGVTEDDFRGGYWSDLSGLRLVI